MKQSVTVRVRGVQRVGMEEETTELRCEGVLRQTADGWLLSYEETQPEGAVKSLLRFDGHCVTLTRRGAVRSEMHFCEGERTKAAYALSAGSFTMELVTERIRADFPRALEVEYCLAIGGETVSEHALSLLMEPSETESSSDCTKN